MPTHLFTYGTLMFPEVWRIVVGRDFESRPATLANYQIFRVADAVYPGIIASDTNPPLNPQPLTLNPQLPPVPGVLYLDVDAASLIRLDRFEGHDYRRLQVEVATADNQPIRADTYIIPPDHRHLLTDEIWTAANFAARGHLAEFIARYGGFHRLDQ
ncbi:MAG: gamma-glutamylcyclotransferase family protein [Pirellulales bacterium]